MASALLTLILAYVLLAFLALVGWPYIWLLVGNRLTDRGWALGRLVAWVIVSLIIWFSAYLRLPTNTTVGIWFTLSLLSVASGFIYVKNFPKVVSSLKVAWQVMVVEEILFIAGFFYLSIVRGFNPAILDLEKFMDAGFMASYLRGATLPALDMWLSGYTINYYSFGHFMGSVLTRIWLLPISLSYNLLLGVIMGLSLSLSFSVVANLISYLSKSYKAQISGGLLGALLVNVGGNTHTFWYLLSHGNWQGYWYADATRFIERTIHEFPSYSYVVSDLHGHVWGLPLVLSFLIILPLWIHSLHEKKPSLYLVPAVLLGVLMGMFAMTSTWDALIYALLTLIVVGIVLFIYPGFTKPALLSALVAVPVAAITALPWLVGFTSISEGIQIASEHSPLWQLAVLWTGHLLLSLCALGVAVRHFVMTKKSRTTNLLSFIIIAMVLTAWLLILLPEVIYFKDIYTGHPRANTMFKFTYQGFVLMSLLGGFAFGAVMVKKIMGLIPRLIVAWVILAVSVCVLLFPYFAYRDYYARLENFKTLDGYQWLYEQYPNDYQAIVWLNQTIAGQPTILESWGESYTTFDRVSAITGLPTVLGWRVHEWLWRGGFDIPGQRTTEVDTMFNAPTSDQSKVLLEKYNVQYIFVGSKEFEQYPNLNIEEMKSLGEVVFESGNTFIVKVVPR